MPRRIHSVNRIIPAVRIHIEPDEVAISIDIPIRIQKPSPLWVIVPALQIVQPRVRIVVIPPILERIERADNPLLNRCRARLGRNRAVAPCVIGVRAYLGSVFRVDGDDVPLQILLEVVGVEYIFGITLVSVLQPDGSAVLVIPESEAGDSKPSGRIRISLNACPLSKSLRLYRPAFES